MLAARGEQKQGGTTSVAITSKTYSKDQDSAFMLEVTRFVDMVVPYARVAPLLVTQSRDFSLCVRCGEAMAVVTARLRSARRGADIKGAAFNLREP